MSTLTLSIKQKYFDEIMAGTKTIETREITPKNAKRYCAFNKDGSIKQKKDGTIVPREYTMLKLLTGAYKGKRPWLKVEINKAEVFLMEDEKGELIVLQDEAEQDYYAAIMEYSLGKVTESSI